MRIHLADPPPLLRRPPSPRGNKDQFGEFRTRNSFFPYILFPKRPRDSFEARLIERGDEGPSCPQLSHRFSRLRKAKGEGSVDSGPLKTRTFEAAFFLFIQNAENLVHLFLYAMI